MKKLAIGCGLIVLLLGIGVVGVGYYGYLKVRSTVNQFAELGKVKEIEQQIRVKMPFAPPSSEELTEAQIDRFMKVQGRIRERLGADAAAFERHYRALAEKKEATVTDVPALLSAYRDMAAAWVNAKRAQVDALNDAAMSLDEYRWIRNQSYRALGMPLLDVDFAKLADQIKSGVQEIEPGKLGGVLTGPGPAANLKRLERYRKQFEDNIAFAAFGL